MKVLVTGANGFIGSHIVEELAREGFNVTCMVRKTSDLKWLSGCKAAFTTCDLSAEVDFSDAVRGYDAIVHSAGVLRAIDKNKYYEINRDATKRLALSALEHNPSLKKFIYISSLAAQGPANGPECGNADPGSEKPISDYGKSKLAGERELKVLEGKIPCTILRPAAVYGPRDKDIFLFFKLVSMGLRPKLFKKCSLQLLFVQDLAKAVVAALGSGATGFNIYPLAEKTIYNWEEIGKIIASSVDKRTIPLPLPAISFKTAALLFEFTSIFTKIPAIINSQKVDELLMPYWTCDVSKTEKDLHVDFTKLFFGGKIAYQWYKSNKWL